MKNFFTTVVFFLFVAPLISGEVTLPVRVHVLPNTTITYEQLELQMNLVSESFEFVDFCIEDIVTISNEYFFSNSFVYDLDHTHYVNLYIVDFKKAAETFSEDYERVIGMANHFFVSLDQRVLPCTEKDYEKCDSAYKFSLGCTGVHEFGHYFGLPHSWDEGCEGEQFIEDIPNEPEPTFTCMKKLNTCYNETEVYVDLHNYMAYTDDFCRYEFSHYQNQYMSLVFYLMKDELIKNSRDLHLDCHRKDTHLRDYLENMAKRKMSRPYTTKSSHAYDHPEEEEPHYIF